VSDDKQNTKSDEDAALGIAISDALAKYPDFSVAGIAPAKFYVNEQKAAE